MRSCFGFCAKLIRLIAYTLMAVIAAHISAVLLHTLTLRDRLIERMTFRFRSKADRSRLG